MVESRSSPARRSDRARPPESELSSISPAAKPETVTRPDTAWHRSSSRSSAVSRGTSTTNALLLCSSRSRASSWLFHLMRSTPPELVSSSRSSSGSSCWASSVTVTYWPSPTRSSTGPWNQEMSSPRTGSSSVSQVVV